MPRLFDPTGKTYEQTGPLGKTTLTFMGGGVVRQLTPDGRLKNQRKPSRDRDRDHAQDREIPGPSSAPRVA